MARLIQPFGMELIAADPFATAELAESVGVRLVQLDELFATSDFISVHCPLTGRPMPGCWPCSVLPRC